MHAIRIDRTLRLAEQPGTGHNRYHPDLEPVLEVGEGEEVVLETRDCFDGQLSPGAGLEEIAGLENGAVHPLTGPVRIRGAQPGDALEVEFLAIEPEPSAVTAILPGLGLLRDEFTEPYLVHWRIADGWATSDEIPGVRIPGAPFMGISAVAPSRAELERWNRREQRLLERGGEVSPPDPAGAVPGGSCGIRGLRTIPPRENGGNLDVKQLTAGSKLVLPVFAAGALFSTGDAHFAQGDGEVCVTAIEMGATVAVRFRVLEGVAASRRLRTPRFRHGRGFADPALAVPERFLGVIGMPIADAGERQGEGLGLACRNAVRNMIDLLEERGFSREQAYVLCSVAVDLRIGNVVNAPNVVVTALLPDMIFD